jgi:hypothetical protein
MGEGRFNGYAGANTDRQRRFEARSARRWGDWGVLAVPPAVLWFDEIYAAAVIEEELGSPIPPIIDLWT